MTYSIRAFICLLAWLPFGSQAVFAAEEPDRAEIEAQATELLQVFLAPEPVERKVSSINKHKLEQLGPLAAGPLMNALGTPPPNDRNAGVLLGLSLIHI